MKSKSGAKKRFRVTGSGRIKRKRAYHRHCFSAKSGKRGRRLRKGSMVDKSNLGQVEIMLLV